MDDQGRADLALGITNRERLTILRALLQVGELTRRDCSELRPPVNFGMAHYHLRGLVDLGTVEPLGRLRVNGGRPQDHWAFGGENAELVAGLLDLWGGSREVVNSQREGSMAKLKDRDIELIGKALSHPIRLALIRDFGDGRIQSPVVWAKGRELTLSHANYHFGCLRECRVLKVVRTQKKRGATEHFYALKGRLSTDALEALEVLDGSAELVPTA